MKLKKILSCGYLLISIFFVWSLYAEFTVHTRIIQFEKGKTSATVEGGVIRGDRDHYILNARSEQEMKIEINSLEDNAVFAVYEPGYQLIPSADGIMEVKGRTLKGAGEIDDAKFWAGYLPLSGNYLVVVGGTRGNCSYSMVVNITGRINNKS